MNHCIAMEEEDIDPVYDTKKREPIFRRDRHLASALHNGEMEYMFTHRKNPAALKREHRILLKDLGDAEVLPSAQYIHWALLHITKQGKEGVSDLGYHIQVANLATEISIEDYVKLPFSGFKEKIPKLLQQVYRLKTDLHKITYSITFSKIYIQEYKFFGCKATCYGNLHMVWVSTNFVYIVAHSYFLAVRDCINAWFSLLCYGLINKDKYPTYNLYNEIANIIYAVLHDIGIYRDEIYTLLKTWQPIVIGQILSGLEANPTFLASLQDTIKQFPHSMLIKIIQRPVLDEIDVQIYLELTGLTKCFGHPEVVMDSSVAAWVEKGSVLKLGQEDISEDIRAAFILEFSRNYYKRHRKWPQLIFLNGADPYINQCFKYNQWTETCQLPWTPNMFKNISFAQTLAFDYQVYTADLLADKSIIPSLYHWPYEYDIQAHRTIHGFFPHKPERASNNAIIHYITQERVNVKEIIDHISLHDAKPEWRVTVAVLKERELKKINARMFGKLTPEMRLYQVATENNIKNIFKYIPHQTMTKTEDALSKHLIRMSNPDTNLLESHVFMALDFSSWCTSFREELVGPLFVELDNLLGVTNVISYTQKFPLQSYLLFQDRFSPPKQGPDGLPLGGSRCFHGPEAWQEGLRQKGWTLATILLILLAAWECKTIATLTGQGDNQVIYLRIPKPDILKQMRKTRREYISHFQKTLKSKCMAAGISLKLEETWVSSYLLEYGREFYYKGSQVSSSLKRISRLASEANQTIPSLNGDLAGLFSTGMSAAQKDHYPTPAYWCTVLEASFQLTQRHAILSRYPVGYMASLLLVTRTLGGYPITIYPSFCTRAVQDPLTQNIHLVRTATRNPLTSKYIVKIATTKCKSNTDPLMLIKDPQSLPLVMPQQPENYLKRKIAEGLPSLVVNEEVRPLLSADAFKQRENLVKDLMNIKPCNPKLLSKLLSLSNIGKQENLVNKFSNTRSIQAIACREWNSELEILEDIRSMETLSLKTYLARDEDQTLSQLEGYPCLTVLAQHLRETGWGVQLEGITMPAQQEQAYVIPWDNLSPIHMPYTISLTLQGDSTVLWSMNRGPINPYIGAPTKIRAKRQPMQELESYSFTQSLSQALQLRSWVHGDKGMTELIDTIIKEKTEADKTELDKRTAHVYSGTLTHRLSCPTMSRGGQSNGTSNFTSHVGICSSTASQFAKKGEDYTVCFQSVFLYGISALNLMYHEFGNLPDRMAIVLGSGCCTWRIPPETFSLESSTYRGVTIPSAVVNFAPLSSPTFVPTIVTNDSRLSYSAHLAYKFAVWLLDRKSQLLLSALERRAIQDVQTPPFANLSEVCRVDLKPFLKSLAAYLLLLHPPLQRSNYKLSQLFNSSDHREGCDDLIDTLRLSGLTFQLCSITGAPATMLRHRVGWYTILSKHMTDLLKHGMTSLIIEGFHLLPDHVDHLMCRYIRTLLRNLQIAETMDLNSSSGIREGLLSIKSKANMENIPYNDPVLCLSEEESIATIRMLPRPIKNMIKPVPIPQPIVDEPYISSLIYNSRVREMEKCIEASDVAQEIFEVLVTLHPHFLGKITEGMLALITIDDQAGEVYNLISHLYPQLIKTGFPHYQAEGQDLDDSLELGPICVTSDPCAVPYDHDLFLGNLGRKGKLYNVGDFQ